MTRKNRLNIFMIFFMPLVMIELVISSLQAEEEVKTWQWENMRPDDLREALDIVPVAWVVFSPLEWHGEAMSFGCDAVIGQAFANKAWKKVGGVRVPTVLIGVETNYKSIGKKSCA